MKVLWFTNTPSLAAEKLQMKVTGGSWLNALEKRMKDKVDLHIAFYYGKQLLSFEYNNTTYHPIVKHNISFLKKNFSLATNSIEPKSDIKLFLKIINKVKPDIIHIHGSENPFGYIIPETKIPVIISIQGVITVYNHKYFQGIEKEYVKKIYSLKHQLSFRSYLKSYNRFNKMAEREQNILNSCKYIIGRTDWDRRVSSILAPNSKYYHCDELLREGFYKFQWNNSYAEKLKLITTTGNIIYKGLETIFETAIILEKLNIDFEWKIAGIKKSDLILKLLKKKIAPDKLSSKIMLLGKIEERELISQLLEANMYIMASHIENSPNNLCEAMILGLPIIATNVGGTSSLIKNDKDGILIQDGDPWVLAGSIVELFNDYDKAKKFGQNARTRAMVRHNPQTITNDLINIYNLVASSDN